jgi:ribosome-associated protein
VYELKHNAQWPASAEGLKNSEWILLDAGDVIVHIFHPEAREKFKLEDLWNPKK